MAMFCISTFGSDQGVTHTATITKSNQKEQTTLITSGMFIHPAWSIRWEESDLPSLSPRPPILTHPVNHRNIKRSPTTIEHATIRTNFIPSSWSDTSAPMATASISHTSAGNPPRLSFIAWAAIIFFLALIGGNICWLCLRTRKKKLALRLEAERLRMEHTPSHQADATASTQMDPEAVPLSTVAPLPTRNPT